MLPPGLCVGLVRDSAVINRAIALLRPGSILCMLRHRHSDSSAHSTMAIMCISLWNTHSGRSPLRAGWAEYCHRPTSVPQRHTSSAVTLHQGLASSIPEGPRLIWKKDFAKFELTHSIHTHVLSSLLDGPRHPISPTRADSMFGFLLPFCVHMHKRTLEKLMHVAS